MTCLHHKQVCTPLIGFHHLFQDCWQVRWSLALFDVVSKKKKGGGGWATRTWTHQGFMVKSRGLLRQLLAAGPFGLGILKSWMDLCHLNRQPTSHTPSYGTCFQPFLKWQVSGCYIYGMLSTEKPWRIPEMSRAYLQFCFTIWYNMRSTNDCARSSQLQPRHPRIGRLFHCSTTSSVHLFPSSAEAQMDGWFVVPRHVIQQYHLQFQGA